MVFHRNQVSRILFGIVANVNNTVVCMVSIIIIITHCEYFTSA